MAKKTYNWKDEWEHFKYDLPHQQLPFSKKNWGNANHSLCSYQGKLKPAIAHFLTETFVPENGIMFDPFAGVGTIPFEAALNGKTSFGMDISIMAYYISNAKIGLTNIDLSNDYINQIKSYIDNNIVSNQYYNQYADFGLNKKLKEYYEINTFNEILLARQYITKNPPQTPSEMVVVSALLHILHGNRPYALSRNSHPITPYAPTGDFIYKNLIEKLTEKVNRFYSQTSSENFKAGEVFLQDCTNIWPERIENLDAIITSPPFFDSTRFYNANWIRLWFCGWEPNDFKIKPKDYVDERQKETFDVYENIFIQAKERLKTNGVLVFHLGKSKKCDMGNELKKMSSKWFTHSELFDESVAHCASFGIKDIGTVTDHQYLILY